jgi:hypothetical protein
MAEDETDDPGAAAERLEAALERIARLAAQPHPASSAATDEAAMTAEEIAARLDVLIGRLRAALGGKPD